MSERQPRDPENPMAHYTNGELIQRMERAEDFKYDDESRELSRRLGARALDWKWSDDFFNPRVVVFDPSEGTT